MKRTLSILTLIFATTWICLSGYATSYYCDPVGGSMGNDGMSTNSAWGSLQSIFLTPGITFSAGDEIFLMNGAHGQPRTFSAGTHTDYVTIKPYPGHTPKIAAFRLYHGSYWALDGLTFTTDGSGGFFSQDYMLDTLDTVNYVKIENCTFYSAEDSSSWSKTDWDTNAKKAVWIRGDHIVFNTNTIINTSFALEIRGDHAEVKGNLIDNFSGDALRALGSHAVYEGNVIRDAYVHDYATNHDDAIQMYPITGGVFDPNGVIDDVVFRNNKIYTFADPITQAMINDNLVGYWMQAIIVTDGHAENMVIENNLVVGDHTHGITLSGPINCRVQNNTVIKTPTPVNPDPGTSTPRINFVNSKVGGYTPTSSTIRNNIASDISYVGSGLTIENNLIPAAGSYTNIFTDYNNFDFSLKINSIAIDAGVNTDLPATDIEGNPRLSGSFVDQGAYEFQLPSPYEVWISDYPGAGTETNMTDNPDNDSLNNLYEWALGGNPDDVNDIGHVPTVGIVEYMGDDWLEYIYAKRNDADALGLTYHVEKNTQLTNSAGWIKNYDFIEGAADSAGSGFASVSNWVNTADANAQFMRLIITCNGVLASTFQNDQWGTHPPENAFDGDLSTKWAAEGTQWIQKNFCQIQTLESIDIAFPFGDERNYDFMIGVSTDGSTFTQVFSGSSGGISTNLESFNFADTPAKHVRITGSGNSVNNWNNCSEIVIHTSEFP